MEDELETSGDDSGQVQEPGGEKPDATKVLDVQNRFEAPVEENSPSSSSFVNIRSNISIFDSSVVITKPAKQRSRSKSPPRPDMKLSVDVDAGSNAESLLDISAEKDEGKFICIYKFKEIPNHLFFTVFYF